MAVTKKATKKATKSKQSGKVEKLAETLFVKLVEQFKFKQPQGSLIDSSTAELMAENAWDMANDFYGKSWENPTPAQEEKSV